MMPLLALVGLAKGNSVAGAIRPVASAHVATTGCRIDEVIEQHFRVLEHGRFAHGLAGLAALMTQSSAASPAAP